MRRTKKIRLLALALAMIMLAPSTAYAAPGRWNSNSWNNNSWNNKSWGNNWNKQDDSSDKTTTTTETELEVVESAETVENPEMLRATTYELTTTETTTTSSTWGLRNTVETVSAEDTIKYFPVTMYNYVANTINAATRAAEDGDELYEGLYFNNGSPGHVEEMVISTSQFVEGQYYIQNMRAKDYGVGSWLKAENGKVVSVNKEDNPTLWTLEVNDDNGTFSLKAEINGSKVYLDLEGTNNGAGDKLVTEKAELEIMEYSHTDAGVQIGKNVDGSYIYLCQFGGNTVTDFGSYHAANDTGNGMQFFKVDENGETAVKLIEKKEIVSGYQEWNHWNKASDDNANGDLMYTGLVAKEMVDDELVFNVPEGGIFNNDDSVKNIYEYVGLPFILDEKTGHYVFDSDAHGVYFEDGKPASGTAEKTNDLIFAKGNPQPFTGSSGDGAINAWYPYNTYTTNEDGNKIYDQAIDYHFGMRADIPFSMTANGRIKGTDDDSKAITFSFSGDDDVWVFIDGKLVIDLGGIHNRLDATIDFAANTITYSEHNTQDPNGDTGSFNDADFSTTQILFTEGNTQGVIAMSRDAFAAKGDHEMQVFYLERGGNTSNCKIEFNLPMNDAVLVTKDATQAWNESAVTEEYDGVEKLTATEQTIINNIDFGFTLYKKDENGFTAVANTNYYLLGRAAGNNQIESTDANGHFYLKNGQSAKFITDIPAEGATYYVIEDTVPKGFITPDFNVDVKAANGFGYFDSIKETAANGKVDAVPELEIPVDAKENRSYAVTAYGSVEANDSVEFICSNFLDAELPNPTALASEDVIVVDYGLPVQIDPLANDMFRGDNVEILYVGGENVTLTENVTAGQLTTATWTEDNTFVSGNVTLNNEIFTLNDKGEVTARDTITYTLTEQLTGVEVLTYITKVVGTKEQGATEELLEQHDYAIGKIYIVPATTMYYEENFNGLVMLEGAGWAVEEPGDEEHVTFQEPGVVGTIGDSVYGSDEAYLDDSGDSNGTSYYGNTSSKAIRFTYTFTGTGTSFFARTSATTGYLQIKLYKGTDTSKSENMINLVYRDTYYQDKNDSSDDASGVLYNVPVYTESGLDYGTYTVVATVAKAGTAAAGANGSGADFYLDGIRVEKPLNELDTRSANDGTSATVTDKALAAYAKDGEANMSVLTLRQKLITDAELETTPWNFAVLTDTNGEIVTLEDYVSFGPKEEVYLKPGQSVTFSVKYWQPGAFKMYMGMKAPFGEGKVQVGQTTYELKNAADCYYDITDAYYGLVTETGHAKDENGHYLYSDASGALVYETAEGYFYSADNTELTDAAAIDGLKKVEGQYWVATYTFKATDKIVSLTNIKVTGNYEFAIVDDVNEWGDVEVNGDSNDVEGGKE